ncbi:Mini-ribonuclease 3 [Halanaerobaculum tunisiense]
MFAGLNNFPDRPNLLSPASLAYIGDNVFELFIRTYLLETGGKPGHLHQQAIEYVNAEAQAKLLEKLRPELTTEEAAIVRRGRNAQTNVPSGVDRAVYQYSTAFEALVGYLYLAEEEERLLELFTEIKNYYQAGLLE